MEAMPGNSTGFGNAGAFYSNKGGGNIDNNPKLSEEELVVARNKPFPENMWVK